MKKTKLFLLTIISIQLYSKNVDSIVNSCLLKKGTRPSTSSVGTQTTTTTSTQTDDNDPILDQKHPSTTQATSVCFEDLYKEPNFKQFLSALLIKGLSNSGVTDLMKKIKEYLDTFTDDAILFPASEQMCQAEKALEKQKSNLSEEEYIKEEKDIIKEFYESLILSFNVKYFEFDIDNYPQHQDKDKVVDSLF